MPHRSAVLLPLLGLLIAAPLVAQERRPPRQQVMLTPYVGLHIADQPLLRDEDPPGGWQVKRGLLVGARLEIPVNYRLAIHGDLGYAESDIDGFGAYQEFSAKGRFVSLSARAALAVTPPERAVAFSVRAGGGIMQHWVAGPAARTYQWPMAVAGAAVRFILTDKIRFSAEAETLLYRAKLGGVDAVSTGQRDYRLILGLHFLAG